MSAGAAFLCQTVGRVWFEVEVVEASGDMTVGFAGTDFRGTTLGEDKRGWGIVKSGAAKHRRVGSRQRLLSPPPPQLQGAKVGPFQRAPLVQSPADQSQQQGV